MPETVTALRILLKDGSTGQYLIPYVDVAESAKTDKNGNVIPDTYATKEEMSGKADSDHTHDYLPLAGGTMSGIITGTITNAQSADSAATATKDSAGQQINSTYIKGVAVNGTTVTFTRGDGTTFSIRTQDTNTVSSNWSVSNGANGWARDNSTGFTIQWGQINASTNESAQYWFPRAFSAVYGVSVQNITSTSNPYKNMFAIYGLNNSYFTGRTDDVSNTQKYIAVGFS